MTVGRPRPAAPATVASDSQPSRGRNLRGARGRLPSTPIVTRGPLPSAVPSPATQVKVVPMKVGVAKETAPGERRVALVPEALGKLKAAGLEILVETGAGAGSAIPDAAFADAGATVVSTDALYETSDVVLKVAKPSRAEVGELHTGQAVVGFLPPLIDPAGAKALADAGVTAISLDAIPRTLTPRADDGRAQLAGERRRLQGGPHRGQRLPALLPAADDRRRHGQARQRPDPRHRRRRAPGDRHGEAPRRRGQRLRRPARDARAGGVPRREVRQAQDDRSTRPAPAATPAS